MKKPQGVYYCKIERRQAIHNMTGEVILAIAWRSSVTCELLTTASERDDRIITDLIRCGILERLPDNRLKWGITDLWYAIQVDGYKLLAISNILKRPVEYVWKQTKCNLCHGLYWYRNDAPIGLCAKCYVHILTERKKNIRIPGVKYG